MADDDATPGSLMREEWLLGGVEPIAPGVHLASCRKCGAALVLHNSDLEAAEVPLLTHIRWHSQLRASTPAADAGEA